MMHVHEAQSRVQRVKAVVYALEPRCKDGFGEIFLFHGRKDREKEISRYFPVLETMASMRK